MKLIFSAIVKFVFVKDILTILLYNAYLLSNKLHANLIQRFSSKTSIGAQLLILLINTLCMRELIFQVFLRYIDLVSKFILKPQIEQFVTNWLHDCFNLSN